MIAAAARAGRRPARRGQRMTPVLWFIMPSFAGLGSGGARPPARNRN
jgi:hypothetical protein